MGGGDLSGHINGLIIFIAASLALGQFFYNAQKDRLKDLRLSLEDEKNRLVNGTASDASPLIVDNFYVAKQRARDSFRAKCDDILVALNTIQPKIGLWTFLLFVLLCSVAVVKSIDVFSLCVDLRSMLHNSMSPERVSSITRLAVFVLSLFAAGFVGTIGGYLFRKSQHIHRYVVLYNNERDRFYVGDGVR